MSTCSYISGTLKKNLNFLNINEINFCAQFILDTIKDS